MSDFLPVSGPAAGVLAALLLVVAVCVRGMWGWRRASDGRAVCLLVGAATAWFVLTGPVERWSTYLLWVHMVQHVVLTLVVAPLLVAAAPVLPFWRGLPILWQRFLLPFVVDRRVRRAMRVVLHPVTALGAYTLSTWLWHAPALYDIAAQDPRWHAVEHGTFLIGSVLLWVQVLEPAPLRSAWSPLARVAIVIAADLQNTAFCALLAFRGAPLYPLYEAGAAAAGMPPLEDQRFAAGIMWVASQVVLLPAAGVLVRRAFRDGVPKNQLRRSGGVTGAGWLASRPSVMEWIARPRIRLVARWLMVAMAAVILMDAFLGPPQAAMNLAGTWTWNVWRGVAIVTIVVLGNVPCVVCPFLAPRGVLRRFVRPRLEWPRALRRKWLAAALLVVWLVAAEWGGWWDSPVATGWVIVAYFASVLVVDTLFKGSSFCAWVCPLGQYQQSSALVSMGGVGSTTKVRLTIHGSNSQARLDRGVLWMMVTAAGFVTALLMTAPVVSWMDRFAAGNRSPGATLAVALLSGLVLVPGVAGVLMSGMDPASFERRFTLGWRAMLPCGVAVWVAHLGFHLVSGWGAAWAAMERAASAVHVPDALPTAVMWHGSVEWLVPAQLIVMQLGVFASVSEVRRTMREGGSGWIALAVLLGALGCWIVLQPMAMRGVLP